MIEIFSLVSMNEMKSSRLAGTLGQLLLIFSAAILLFIVKQNVCRCIPKCKIYVSKTFDSLPHKTLVAKLYSN